jgi:ParB family chromosome partitioning protein
MIEGEKNIIMVEVDSINILNPRVRNKKIFNSISENISKVGLKKPITVTKSSRNVSDKYYDLVCGQGRLEAFIEAGCKYIPAIISDASEEKAMIMSLVENLARRNHNSLDLLSGIERLHNSGYNATEISIKTGLVNSYVYEILNLIKKSEQRLLSAVESGKIPLSVAIRIASSDGEDVQNALQEAYESNQLRGKKLEYARKVIELRSKRGKHLGVGSGKRSANPPKFKGEDLVKIFQKEVERKKLISKKANFVNNQIKFISGALKKLFKDEKFNTLLKSEGFDTFPKQIMELLGEHE